MVHVVISELLLWGMRLGAAYAVAQLYAAEVNQQLEPVLHALQQLNRGF